jgi:hypothetical protein
MRRSIAAALAQGQVLVESFPEYRDEFDRLLFHILEQSPAEWSLSR